MKAMKRIKNAAVWGLSALTLASVMLFSVACTRGGDKNPGDSTSGGSTAVTTPATGNNGTGTTTRPLDPGAGTVVPDGDAADPPTGTEGGTRGRSVLPNMIH